VALLGFLVIWQGATMAIDNNRMLAYPGYT